MAARKKPYRMVLDGKVYFSTADTKRILTCTESRIVRFMDRLDDEAIADITHDLNHKASWCYETFRNESRRLSPKAVTATLEELKKKADKFLKCLSALDEHTKYLVLGAEVSPRLLDLTREYVEWISEGSMEALSKIDNPDSKENPTPRRSPRINFITHLAVIYERVTERKARISRPSGGGVPRGPFVRFVTGCLRQVDDSVGPEMVRNSISEAMALLKDLDPRFR